MSSNSKYSFKSSVSKQLRLIGVFANLCIVEVELATVAILYVSNYFHQYSGPVISTETKICLKNFLSEVPAFIILFARSISLGPIKAYSTISLFESDCKIPLLINQLLYSDTVS